MLSKGDTVICFSISQSKFILKKINAFNECDTLLSICNQQVSYCDSIRAENEVYKNTVERYKIINRDINDNYVKEIDVLKYDIEDKNKKIRIEKVKKTLWIGATALVSGLFIYHLTK